MKKGFFSCVAMVVLAVFLSAGSVFAADENTGFYVGISGGYVIPQTMTISNPDNSAEHFDATLNNGYMVGVKSGWLTPFTRRIMALEMEYNYIRNDFDNDKIVDAFGEAGKLDGTVTIHALLFNVKARYPEGRIHPYAGVGLGYAYFEVGDLTGREPDGTLLGIMPSESAGAFCWQLMAGVDFDITPNLGVGIGYKYFATKPTLGDKYGDGMYYEADYRASIITVGLNFTF
jgi:opacity protein-like surface antigen